MIQETEGQSRLSKRNDGSLVLFANQPDVLLFKFCANLSEGLEPFCGCLRGGCNSKQNIRWEQVAFAESSYFLQPSVTMRIDCIGLILGKVKRLDNLSKFTFNSLYQRERGVNLLVPDAVSLEGGG